MGACNTYTTNCKLLVTVIIIIRHQTLQTTHIASVAMGVSRMRLISSVGLCVTTELRLPWLHSDQLTPSTLRFRIALKAGTQLQTLPQFLHHICIHTF